MDTMNKKGIVNAGKPFAMINGVIGVLIFVAVLVVATPLLITSFGNLSTVYTANSLPFASFFASGGVLYLVLAGAILIGVIGLFRMKGKGGY